MISPTLKITSIAVGAGGILTGAGVGAYHAFFKPTEKVVESNPNETKVVKVEKEAISSLLLSDNRQLLKKGKNVDDKWNPLWKKFRDKHTQANAEPAEPWKFANWAEEKVKEAAPEEFQTKCIDNSEGKVDGKNDALYQTIRDYCTEEITKSSPP